MNDKRFAFVSALTTAFAVASLVAQAAAGQDRAGGTETSSTVAAGQWTVPCTADGQPDLQGVWLNTSATPFERPEALAGREFLTDDEVAELSRRASRIFKENDADLAIGDALYRISSNACGCAPCEGAVLQRVRIPPGNCRSSR